MKKFTLSILGALLALLAPFAATAQDNVVNVQCNDINGIYVLFHNTFVKDYTTNDFTISQGEVREKYDGSGSVTMGSAWNIVFASKSGYTLKSVTVDGIEKSIIQNQELYPNGYANPVPGRQKCTAGTFSALKGKTIVVTVEKEVVETATFTLDMSAGSAEHYTAKFSETGREFSLVDGIQEVEFNPALEQTLVLTAKVMATLDRTTVTVNGENINRSLKAFYVPVAENCKVNVAVEEDAAKEFEISLTGVVEALKSVRVGYTAVDFSDHKFSAIEGESVRLYFDDSYSNFTVKCNDGEVISVSGTDYAFTPTENTVVTIGARSPELINVTVNVSDPAAFTVYKVNPNGERVEGLKAGANTVQLLSTKNTIFWTLNPGYGVNTGVVLCEGKTFTQISNDISEHPRFNSPFQLNDLAANSVINLQAVTYDFDKTVVTYFHPSTATPKGSLVFPVPDHYALPEGVNSVNPFANGYQTIDFCTPMASEMTVIRGFLEADGAVYLNNKQIRQMIVDDIAQAWQTQTAAHGDVYKVYPGVASVKESALKIWTSQNVKETATIKCDVINKIDHSDEYEGKVLPGTLITITGIEDLAVRVNGEYIAPSADAIYAAINGNSDEIDAPLGRTFSFSTEEGKDYSIEVGNSEDVTSGIGFIGVDTDAPAEFYNLQGIRVHEPVSGGVYIRKQGNSVSKIVVK